MRILIIGYQGYVGSGLFHFFSQRHSVLGWSRTDDLFRLKAKHIAQKKIQLIINCAAVIDRVTRPFQQQSPSALINVEGAKHLASILRGSDVGWIQISTKDVYGAAYGAKDVVRAPSGYRPRFLVDGTRGFAPETIYAKSKLMSEYVSESHPSSNVIRLSTCYTDHDHAHGNWMVALIKAALRKKPFPVTHNGLQFRDPLHVDDLGALIERMVKKKIAGQKINAGGGIKNIISLKEFIHLLPARPSIHKLPGNDYGFAFDNRAATALTGWRPTRLVRDQIPLLIRNIHNSLFSA